MATHESFWHSVFKVCKKMANFGRALGLENGKRSRSCKLERFDHQA